MLIESRRGTEWASSNDGLSWKDEGLLVVKHQRTSHHGHVTPFLFADANKHILYFGAARSEHWNQNSIMRVGISFSVPRPPAWILKSASFAVDQ